MFKQTANSVGSFIFGNFSVRTTAKITAKEPDNHLIVRDAFEVGNTTFTGLQSAGSEFDRLNIEESNPVYFILQTRASSATVTLS